MAPAVANQTCDAFTPVNASCNLGSMVSYSVDVSTTAQVSESIAFAKGNNIRLVVRNTGHDYLGKSTGAGALSIWTHHVKDVEFMNFASAQYNGPAVKIGAGIQDAEAYAAADKQGVTFVGGDCATVGAAGGYTQGGGHSALSSKFGLAADQALEWEVIDGSGQLRRASRSENVDLYWALSGGGGGTYGIVWSLTVKVFPKLPVTGAVLKFDADPADLDRFYEAIGSYHELLPGYTAAGAVAIAEISNSSFLLTPGTFPEMDAGQVRGVLRPLIERLEDLGITYKLNVTEFPDFLEHYNALIEPNPTQLVNNAQYGGWMIPLSVIEGNNDQLTAAVRNITQGGAVFTGIGLNVSSAVTGDVHNSVLPAWRDTAVNAILTSPWPNGASLPAMGELARRMTNEWVPALSDLAPDSGCYMSEADPNQPNWKQAFYGSNYQPLSEIKDKYDPEHVFYAPTAVGSDAWQVQSNGALCWTGKA